MSARGRLLAALLCTGSAAVHAAEPRIEVQALFRDRAVLMVDGKRRVLGAGETSPEGITLVDADARAAVVEIAGVRRTLALGTRIGATFTGPREQRAHAQADGRGMYVVAGTINGVPVEFMLDTGATLVSISEPLAMRLNLDYRRLGRPGQSITAAGMVNIWQLRLARVKVGEIELIDVDAAVHEGAFPDVALLGNSFLSRVEMTRAAGAVILRRTF